MLAGGAAQRHGGAALRLRGVRPPAPDGTAIRRRGWHGRLLEAIDASASTSARWRSWRDHDIVDQETRRWLADYRFSGDIWRLCRG